MPEVRILVVGGASLDTLADAGQLVAGGAGMYTAMAARRLAALVTLYAPCPDPMPAALQPVADRLSWLGPKIAQGELAHFEIRYEQGRATYVVSRFGAEEWLSPEGLPADLSGFDCVHLVPLGDLARQYSFLLACRERGARRISAGTALHLINVQPDDAAAILISADILFMNEEEAVRLFGSLSAAHSRAGQLLFVTRGRDGATVIQGDTVSDVPGVAADVVDPTGAGDSFCGATLVGIASGMHPVMAARRSMPLAAAMTQSIGPAELLRPPPAPAPSQDARVRVNLDQLGRIARLVAELPEITPYPFVDTDLPPPDHPAALNYFFAATLQQFGFWHAVGGRYERPLIATIDGEVRKGAFYLFRAWLRWLNDDPEKLTPAGQAALTRSDFLDVLRADNQSDPMPELELHLSLAQQYGRDMLALGLTPQSMLQRINATRSPLPAFMQILDHVAGYKEDPLRKKAALLAVILRQRPEQFMPASDDDVAPIVDYHVMRSCLRTGLVDVTDEALSRQLVERSFLSAADEWAVRCAAYSAMQQLVLQSGKSMGAVDWFFFQARQRCPEMSAPKCDECAIDATCAHRKDLFQPVLRTSFY